MILSRVNALPSIVVSAKPPGNGRPRDRARHRRSIFRLAAWLAVVCLTPSSSAATIIPGTLDAIPPPQSVHYVGEATGQMSRRLSMNDSRSTCGSAKSFPGVYSVAGSYRYDAYTFTALETRCLTVRVQRVGDSAPYVSAYSVFHPGNLADGYLADSGVPAGFIGAAALSVNVTAGQTYTIVVANTVHSNEGARYELTFDEPFTDTIARSVAPPSSPMFFGEITGGIFGPRVFRDGARSSCGVPRAFPGTAGTGPYRFDKYLFVAPLSGCITVRLRLFGGFGSVLAYANDFYPTAVGTGWLAEAGVGVTSPFPEASFSMQVTRGQTYALVVVNAVPADDVLTYELGVTAPAQPPRLFRTSGQDGHAVTFRWEPPIDGPTPTSYVIEGGINPGQALATIPTGGVVPLMTLVAPDGAYYLRVRTVSGLESSTPSNEVRIFVNTPTPPSAPVDLTGLVNGSSLVLSWRNTFDGAPPTGLVVDVTGSAVASLPLALGDTASFAAAPGGSYTLRLRATNAAGSSSPSNPITINIPGGCAAGPRPPANFLAYRVGNTIVAVWDAPPSGPSPTSFVLDVSGAFVGSFQTSGRSLGGPVGPGVYQLAVRAQNLCGTSVATPVQTVTVP